jgi:hypothetical protein
MAAQRQTTREAQADAARAFSRAEKAAARADIAEKKLEAFKVEST